MKTTREGELVVHDVVVASVGELDDPEYDAVVVVTSQEVALPQQLEDFILAAQLLDSTLVQGSTPAVLQCKLVSSERLVLAPTGTLTAYDDVRSVYEAARAGVRRAASAGSRRPVLVLAPHPRWPRAELVALLGALEALYVPLQVRESSPDQATRLQGLGIYGEAVSVPLQPLIEEAVALEVGRGLARDVTGADPERMTPAATAQLLQEQLAGGAVSVRVLDDAETIQREYPLFSAVSRAADTVERHKGCIIFLEYVPSEYESTVMLVGKGVTYDTGGADIKTGGAMVGMSGDKAGAAAIAGFLKVCDLLRPQLKVVAALAMVRNSIGEECYVADELLRSRTGLSVRVGNTDAEGRMIMADLLAEMRERAADERQPHLYTVATLTGHAARTYGAGYTAALDNHVAAATKHAQELRAVGTALADGVEVSTVRREDLAAHRGRAAGDQLLQAVNQPSVNTPRGHQAPTGFLLLVSGLERGDVPYTHLDISGSAGSHPSPPTAAPLIALAALHGLVKSI
ncbi:putative aminopeptidase W07G4.4 [Achroia grisella]|uniref:putative aminopeptidase W07G4.4 n=1 Tax=Achroia grisella TaxID=688607 RepID=UPI0027D30003|nr:putative aminopeptidase W07G4.4 [Achroia grisella]